MLPIVKTIHGPAQIWSFDCYLGTGTVYASAMPLSARECASHFDTLTTLDPPMPLKCQNEQNHIFLDTIRDELIMLYFRFSVVLVYYKNSLIRDIKECLKTYYINYNSLQCHMLQVSEIRPLPKNLLIESTKLIQCMHFKDTNLDIY